MDDDQEYALEYMPVFLQRITDRNDLVLGWRRKRAIPVWRKAGTWVTNLMVFAVIRKRMHDMGAIKVFGNKAACLLRSCGSFFGAIKYFRHIRISEIIMNDFSSGCSRYNFRKLSLLFFQVVYALLNRRQ